MISKKIGIYLYSILMAGALSAAELYITNNTEGDVSVSITYLGDFSCSLEASKVNKNEQVDKKTIIAIKSHETYKLNTEKCCIGGINVSGTSGPIKDKHVYKSYASFKTFGGSCNNTKISTGKDNELIISP